MWKKILPILMVPLLLAGCATTMTNLTPLHQPRNANNLYRVEVSLDTRQQTIRWDTIQPYVLVGTEAYQLHKVPMVDNRWEGFVPVPPTTDSVQYRYKIDFLQSDFGGPTTKSLNSLRFEMHITNP